MHLLAALVCHTTTALSAPNLRARKVHLDDAWSLTVYEKKDIVMSVETWMATEEESVDPFGGVAWPGAVVAARALRDYGVENKVVCCVGCGTGVEVLAAAALELADGERTDSLGRAPLHLACMLPNGAGGAVVDVLLSFGVDAVQRTSEGHRPIDLANHFENLGRIEAALIAHSPPGWDAPPPDANAAAPES